MQTSSYMILRGKTYWFNYALPFSSTRLRLSLQSHSKKIAQAVAYRLSLRVNQYLEVVSPVQYSEAEIKTLARQWAEQLLQEVKEDALTSGTLTDEKRNDLWEHANTFAAEARKAIAHRDFSHSSRAADLFIEEHKLPISKDSYEYTLLRSEMNTHSVTFFDYEQALYAEGKPLPEKLFPHLPTLTAPTTPPEANTKPSPSVIEVYEDCKKDKVRSGEWSTDKTVKTNDSVIGVLIEIKGNKPIKNFSKADVRDYKEKLLTYPLNRTKAKHLKDRNLEEIVTDGEYKTISEQTAHNQFDKIKAVFSWAEMQGYIDRSPFMGMSIKVNANHKDKRLPFSDEDLSAIFQHPIFTQRKFKQSWHYWVPLIGLYTGARINEICQLKLVEIALQEDIQCFHFVANEEGRRLKNAASKRILPIHQHLIELGFLDYVKRLKAEGESMLFPTLKTSSTRNYGQEPSKWFGHLKRKLITEDEKKKVFHSFRHNMADALRSLQTEGYIISQMLGHEQETTTHQVYGSYQASALEPAIRKISWGEPLIYVKPFFAKED